MSDASESNGQLDAPVRSTTSVLLLLAGLVLLPVLALIAIVGVRGGGGDAGSDLAAAVNDDRVQAVYLANDQVFFGRVREAGGSFIELQDAFFLRRAATTDAEGKDEAEAGLDLVPVAQDIDGDGDLVINVAEVVRVQDLNADAEIAQSIEDALE